MGTPAQGFKKYIQIGLESVWGTGVAATRKLGIVSESFSPEIALISSQTMDGEVTVPDAYVVREMARGTIVFELNYEGQLLVFDWLFGTGTFGTKGGVTTGAGPTYTHTFNPGVTLNSYTIEVFKDIPSGKCHKLVGAKVSGWRIRGEAGAGDGAILKLEVDVVAKSITSNATPTAALSITTRIPALYHQATTVDEGTADSASDVRIKSFDLAVASSLHEDRDYLSASTPDQFLRSERISTTLSLTKELQTRTMLDAIKAGTPGAPNLVFTSGTKSINISIGTAKLEDYKENQNGFGIETISASWRALRTSSSPNYDLRIVVINAESTIT